MMRLCTDKKRRSKLGDRQRREKTFCSNSFLDDEAYSETEMDQRSFSDSYSTSGYSGFDSYGWPSSDDDPELDDPVSESEDDSSNDDDELNESYKMLVIPAIVGQPQ